MKKILIIGAGRSTASLIRYLYKQTLEFGWTITVGDIDASLAQEKSRDFPGIRAIPLDTAIDEQVENEINNADLVISMLPPANHLAIASACIKQGKHLLTASYLSPAIKSLHKQALEKDVLILTECGLDPGIDHMSAMQLIDRINAEGGEITSFKSYAGGLVAPESDNNPWGYKFTWNPRNVITAGQGTVKYMENNHSKYIPYHRLFTRTETVQINGYGAFDAYANRDSLSYKEHYNLHQIPTLLRGTLRKPGFCKAWNIFVQLGLTEDTYEIDNLESLTYKKWLQFYLPERKDLSLAQNLAAYMQLQSDDEAIQKITWLGLFEDTPIGMKGSATPAKILQHMLEQKWKLEPSDKDMVVMKNELGYILNGKPKEIHATLVTIGEDSNYTAMANTVGLPLGIAAKLILLGTIKMRGVLLPVYKEIYEPILKELETYGINFHEAYF